MLGHPLCWHTLVILAPPSATNNTTPECTTIQALRQQQRQTPTNDPPLNTLQPSFAVRCPACTNTFTPSMLLCRPVCPTHSHCVQTLSPCNACAASIPRRSCLVCVQHTPPLQHHTTHRFHCPISQCATSLHHPAQHTTKRAMCCFSLSSKHPNTHSTHLGCSMLSWSCSIHCPSAAVPLRSPSVCFAHLLRRVLGNGVQSAQPLP